MTLKQFSILYVDDEPANLRVFNNTFRWEYKIYTALSPQEGLEIFKSKDIDLVITDQRMPVMSGVDFLKTLLKEGKPVDVPFILISGYSDYDAVMEAKNICKIYKYVSKPWNPDELGTTIKEILNR